MKFLINKKSKLKTINDIVDIKLEPTIESDRKKYKILIIDDEGFAQKEGLNKLGFKDIDVKFNYTNMEEYSAYDIIFCDINGVAKEIDPYFQGAALAKMIKEMYPDKYVIIFSALDQSLDFYPYYSSVDATIIKNLNSNQLSEKLDQYIATISSPKYKWDSIKRILEFNKIPTEDIAVFEDFFVRSFLDGKDYSSDIKKYCQKSLKEKSEIMKKILPYVFDVMKDVVIMCVTK